MNKIIIFFIPVIFLLSQGWISDYLNEKQYLIELDWAKVVNEKKPNWKSDTTISNDVNVSLKLKNFNYFHYKLDMSVNRDTIQAYRALEKIWDEVFSLDLKKLSSTELITKILTLQLHDNEMIPQVSVSDGVFENLTVSWRKKIIKINRNIIRYISEKAGSLSIDPKQLKLKRDSLTGVYSEILDSLAFKCWNHAKTNEQLDFYLKIEEVYQKLLSKIKNFNRIADLVINGKIEKIGKNSPGTIVTIALNAKDEKGNNKGKIVSLEYFVESKYGLVFHGGFAHSALGDFGFKQVKALTGENLYQKIKDNKTREDLVLFLSYPFFSLDHNENWKVLGTIGTDIKKPKDHIYLGLSLNYKKLFISGGFVSGEISEGDNEISKEITQNLGAKTLYESVIKRRCWQPFISASFHIY